MRKTLPAVGVAMALVAAGCSGGGANHRATVKTATCPTGRITGAGSTVLDTLVRRWIKDYTARCKDASVTYQAVGSPTGVGQLSAGSVTFAATDAPLTADQEQASAAKGQKVLHIPWAGDGVAIAYHLAGVSTLSLSADALAGIFSGVITRWDDPKLQADNAGTKLPATAVHVVYRSDDNPATTALTGYLASSSPTTWSAGIGAHLASWPTGQPADNATAMADALERDDGTIGYAETSAPRRASLGVARIKNSAGKFVTPQPAAMTAALAEATVPPDLKVVPNYAATSPTAYPLTFPTFAVVFAKLADAGQVDLLKDFLHYALDRGQPTAASLNYAPLPDALRDKARTAIDGITTTGPSTSTTGVGVVNAIANTTTTSPGSVNGAAPGKGGGQTFPVPPGGNGGATAIGVTGGNLAVANVSTLGGPQPGLMSGAPAGTAAFFAYQNSLGGVYGRALSIVSADDGFDAAKNQSAYADLVGKVFGFVGSSSWFDYGGASVLGQHPGVPDVSEAQSSAHLGVSNNFSVAPFPPGGQLGPLNYFKAKYGASVVQHMAMFTDDTPSTKDTAAGEMAAANSVGYHFAYSRTFEPTESDFTSDIPRMQAVGVQGVMMVGPVAQMVDLSKAMDSANFKPPLANFGLNAYDPAFLGSAPSTTMLSQPMAMYGGEDNLQEVALFVQWLKHVAPNQAPDLYAAYGWESARLFVQALGAAGPRPTQAGVLAQLKAIDNFDGNGMLAPAGPASKRPPTCFITIGVNNNKFVRSDPPSGFICNQGGYFTQH